VIQPVPPYTEEDLERLVAREFAPEAREEAKALLARYGTESWHREPVRVCIACLKHAAGDLAALQKAVTDACRDYRDILAEAEYPRSLTARDPEAKMQAIEDDWNDLLAWLRRGHGAPK
jgi:hypothetical protein